MGVFFSTLFCCRCVKDAASWAVYVGDVRNTWTGPLQVLVALGGPGTTPRRRGSEFEGFCLPLDDFRAIQGVEPVEGVGIRTEGGNASYHECGVCTVVPRARPRRPVCTFMRCSGALQA